MMKWDRTVWSRSALAKLSQERVLIGQLDLRHGNMREAEGGRVVFLFLYVLIES